MAMQVWAGLKLGKMGEKQLRNVRANAPRKQRSKEDEKWAKTNQH